MNMFKNIFATALFVFGLALVIGNPTEWKWPEVGGPYLVIFVQLCADTRPFSYAICGIVALALFMLRKQY